MPFKFMTSWHHIDNHAHAACCSSTRGLPKSCCPINPHLILPRKLLRHDRRLPPNRLVSHPCWSNSDQLQLQHHYHFRSETILTVFGRGTKTQLLKLFEVWTWQKKKQSPRPVTTTSQPSPGKMEIIHKNSAANKLEPEPIPAHKHFPMCSIWV